MSSLSSWVRLLPGVQSGFLDAVESQDAWHAKPERRIATHTQELADLQRRLEDSRSRIADLISSKWTAAQLQEVRTMASPAEDNGLRPTGSADLRSLSSTAHN